jgi:rubrerythrin
MTTIPIKLIRQAIKNEEDAYEFYKRIKDLFSDKESINLCEELMLSELRHKSIIQELYLKDLDDISEKIEKLGAYDLDFINSLNSPLAFKDIELILKYALKKEANSVMRYTKYLDIVSDYISKDFFNKLIKEEKKHVEMISKEIERYRKLKKNKSVY